MGVLLICVSTVHRLRCSLSLSKPAKSKVGKDQPWTKKAPASQLQKSLRSALLRRCAFLKFKHKSRLPYNNSSLRRPDQALGQLAVKDLHESLPELNVEGGVDDGVDGAVDVPQPREGVVHGLWDVAVTMHVQDVGDEEGEPADDEDTCRDHMKQDKLVLPSLKHHQEHI